jgi:Tfp pilus assembly protein PilV
VRRCARGRRDATGTTLLEVLIAVALVATVLLGVMAGMLTTVKASGSNSSGVTSDAALVSVSERMKSLTYRPCGAATADYEQQLNQPRLRTAAERDIEVRVERVDHWQPAPTNRYAAACPTGGDRGTQLVTVVVTVGDSASRGSVVIRNPTARPA